MSKRSPAHGHVAEYGSEAEKEGVRPGCRGREQLDHSVPTVFHTKTLGFSLEVTKSN